MQGAFRVDDFITHTMGLGQINEPFVPVHPGKCI